MTHQDSQDPYTKKSKSYKRDRKLRSKSTGDAPTEHSQRLVLDGNWSLKDKLATFEQWPLPPGALSGNERDAERRRFGGSPRHKTHSVSPKHGVAQQHDDSLAKTLTSSSPNS